tara:strand:- start:5429 stop:6112 length:684 start_codon:yes stop_codon:yes gene_type:complete
MSINQLPNDLIEASKQVLTKEEDYKDFFQKVMKKFGVKSPGELSGDKEKEFYNYIDKNWKGKKEDIDKMQEWISAGGERRRVKEGDSRKVKVEDVVRDMWEQSAKEQGETPVGKYQTPKLRDESLDEGIKKSKLKIDNRILKDLKKLEKNEKGMNDKEVKFIHDMFKKGVEVESEDGEPAVISNKALKTLDKVWGKLDTFVRDEIYSIMKKHDDDQMSAVLGPYVYG